MSKPVREVPWLGTRHGVYNIFWYEPSTEAAKQRNPQAAGRTKRLGLRTRDAQTAAARLAAFITTGYHRASDAGQLTVVAALRQYEKEHVDRKVRAKERALIAIRHLVEFFGDTPLTIIDKMACRAFIAARRKGAVNGGKPVVEATARRELVVLQAAAHHARSERRITLDMMPTFELPPIVHTGSITLWFTKDELATLFDRAHAGDQRVADFMTLAYWWGARRSSVAHLETSQVHLSNGLVNLHKAGDPITNKRRGIVPIFPEQRETLERLTRDAADTWLFGRGYNPYKPFHELCLSCGLPEEKAKPHVLRHSRATHMLMAGEPIYKVAKLLGDSVETIETVYGHSSTEFLLGTPRPTPPSLVQVQSAALVATLPQRVEVPKIIQPPLPVGRRKRDRRVPLTTWQPGEQDRNKLDSRVAEAQSRFRGVGAGHVTAEKLDALAEFLEEPNA